mmetsp:Transcript_45985/g.91125  ORF Transcript_45985/g.91125 Transcript_45985/m.91125 type:complete len:299 (-) Transcript_45985:42-938(-)
MNQPWRISSKLPSITPFLPILMHVSWHENTIPSMESFNGVIFYQHCVTPLQSGRVIRMIAFTFTFCRRLRLNDFEISIIYPTTIVLSIVNRAMHFLTLPATTSSRLIVPHVIAALGQFLGEIIINNLKVVIVIVGTIIIAPFVRIHGSVHKVLIVFIRFFFCFFLMFLVVVRLFVRIIILGIHWMGMIRCSIFDVLLHGGNQNFMYILVQNCQFFPLDIRKFDRVIVVLLYNHVDIARTRLTTTPSATSNTLQITPRQKLWWLEEEYPLSKWVEDTIMYTMITLDKGHTSCRRRLIWS